MPLSGRQPGIVGFWTAFLRAKHDAGFRWPQAGLGLDQWLCRRARLEWLPVPAAPVELVTRWPTAAKPRAAIEQAAWQIYRVAKYPAGTGCPAFHLAENEYS